MAKKSELTLTIRARNALKKGLRKAKRSLRKFGKSVKKVIGGASKIFKGLARGVMAVGGALAATIREGYKFKQGMAKVSTMLGDNQDMLKGMTDRIRTMAAEFGQSKEALTKGLYDILSAGIKASGAMEVLEAATKSAIGGITSTDVAVDALTTVLNAYDMEAEEATHVTDVLAQIVNDGKITFEQLAQNISKLAPTAKAAGVSLEKMGAIVASVVKVEKPERAMTAIRSALMEMAERGEDLVYFARRFKNASLEEIMGEDISREAATGIAILTGNVSAMNGELKEFADVAEMAKKAFGRMSKVRQWERTWQMVRSTLSMVGEAIHDKIAPGLDRLHKRFISWAKGGALAKMGVKIKTLITQAEGLVSMMDELGTKEGGHSLAYEKVAPVIKSAFNYGVTKLLIAGNKMAVILSDAIRNSLPKWMYRGAEGLKDKTGTPVTPRLGVVGGTTATPASTTPRPEKEGEKEEKEDKTADPKKRIEELNKKLEDQADEFRKNVAKLGGAAQRQYEKDRVEGPDYKRPEDLTIEEQESLYKRFGVMPTAMRERVAKEREEAEKKREAKRLEEERNIIRGRIKNDRKQKRIVEKRRRNLREELKIVEERAEAINAEKYANMRIKKAISERGSAREQAKEEEEDFRDVMERAREIQAKVRHERQFDPDYMPSREDTQFLKNLRTVLEARMLEDKKERLENKLGTVPEILTDIKTSLNLNKKALQSLLKMG